MDAFLPPQQQDPGPLDDRAVFREAYPLPAISGGTLLITRDLTRAIVSNQDFGRVHVVDIPDATLTGSIELDRLANPGRAVEDDDGFVHVVLRGSGSVITIEPTRAQVLRETQVCSAPRGIAFDSAMQQVLVACATGEVVGLDTDGTEVERFDVAPDIRDLVLRNGSLYVSRMRSAELLEVGQDRRIVARAPVELESLTDPMQANTAWRLGDSPMGALMLHQFSSLDPIEVDFEADQPPVPPYGGPQDGCASLVTPAVSVAGPDGTWTSALLPGVVLAVDAAMSPDGSTVAVAVAGQSDYNSPTQEAHNSVLTFSTSDLEDVVDECGPPTRSPPIKGQAVAVAYDQRGWLYVQTRDADQLHMVAPLEKGVLTVDLTRDNRLDTGHDLFHQDTGAGIACASCHAEGGDDGMVWTFDGLGPRRTQALDAGLRGTEPFHWEGDFDSLPELLDEVHNRRMAAAKLSDGRIDALSHWMLTLPAPGPRDVPVDARARGEVLFEALNCAACHSGPNLTNNQTVDVRGVLLQVPNLRGVAMRAPFMHDGRSPNLEAAVVDMVDYSAKSRLPLGEGEMADMIAYLESL